MATGDAQGAEALSGLADYIANNGAPSDDAIRAEARKLAETTHPGVVKEMEQYVSVDINSFRPRCGDFWDPQSAADEQRSLVATG